MLVIEADDAQKAMVDKLIKEMATEEWKAKADKILPDILVDKRPAAGSTATAATTTAIRATGALSVSASRTKGRPPSWTVTARP